MSRRCGKNFEAKETQISNVIISRDNSSFRDVLVPNICAFHNNIPKHITTFDDKYAMRCFNLIRGCALRAASWKFTSKVDALPDDLSNYPKIEIPGSFDITRKAIEINSGAKAEVIITSSEDWTTGTVSYSPSTMNILKSPLFQRFNSADFDLNNGETGLLEAGKAAHSKFASDVLSDHNPRKEVRFVDHERVVSNSIADSINSAKPSSSSTVSSFKGMLQCIWKNELPHHVFTIDDSREVLLANLSKTESSDAKAAVDYVYTFYSRKRDKKNYAINELDFQIVGKMQVSTSITFGCNNTEALETRSVLSVPGDEYHPAEDIQISDHNLERNKRLLTRKVANLFKSNHSFKRVLSSKKFEGSSAFVEDTHENLNTVETNDEEKCSAPNHELAAIIIKVAFKNRKETDSGGWGLKFLKKLGRDTSSEESDPLEYTRDNNGCSTSMNVLIPAGVHGGPRTTRSRLIERWISGGQCDCGGWDLGCPLTVLGARSNAADLSPELDHQDACKSIDLYIQGSKQGSPVFKIVNIHEDLYFVHFQSTLSTLQAFAIVTAMVHSCSPVV